MNILKLIVNRVCFIHYIMYFIYYNIIQYTRIYKLITTEEIKLNILTSY